MRRRVVKAARIGSFGLLAASFMAACGRDESGVSEVKVTNGVQISHGEFPSVVLLLLDGKSICTGTFVNGSQVVTAAHCVYGMSENNPDIRIVQPVTTGGRTRYVEKARATGFVQNRDYSLNVNNGVNHNDLAIINFEDYSSEYTRDIAESAPEVDQEITIVGYGNNHNYLDEGGRQTGEGAGSKRVGTNFVRLVEDGMILFVGLTQALDGVDAGDFSASGSGDSGGPLFVNGELAGITSGGGVVRTKDGQEYSVSKYVDINSHRSREFLARYLK